jgi:hypothetical protein
LGELVEVVIDIAAQEGSISVPAAAIKTSNRLWEVTDTGTLKAHQVNVLSRTQDRASVSSDSLQVGADVLVSDLPAPFDGQEVRIDGEAN